jgi:hypothetical protein
MLPSNYRGGTDWRNTAWWHPAGWVLFANGETTAWPAGLSEPDGDGNRSWFGDRGDGVSWHWGVFPFSETLAHGRIYWRSDLNSLWNPVNDRQVGAPYWMRRAPAPLFPADWDAVPIVPPPRADGLPDLRRVAQVRIIVNYYQALGPDMVPWKHDGRVFRVWPPRQYLRRP